MVLDLFSRKVVGWAMSDTADAALVRRAFEAAVGRRRPPAGVLVHSDRGCQYTSADYQRVLASAGVVVSFSRKGNCWDNAPTESFFASRNTDPTATASRRRRCRGGYNRGDRVPVGPAGVGPLLPGVPHPHRRSRTMSDRPAPIPPRA